MAFPSSPSDGQQIIVGNVTYSYSASKTAWYRIGTVANPVTSTVDTYTGDGTETTFALSALPANENYTFAAVGGVLQPRNTYSVAGTTIIFSSAPPVGAPIEITTFGGSGASTYSNNSVYAYLSHHTGNVAANSVIADGFYFANGAPFISSLYGDSNVADYIENNTITNIHVSNMYAGANLVSYGGAHIQGDIIPLANEAYDLGSSTYKFRSLYLSGNTINLGLSTIGSLSNGAVTVSNTLIVNGDIIDGTGIPITTYANVLNAAMVANITATNAAVVTANTGMKSYVDAQVIASSGYSNVAAAAYLSVASPVYVGNIKSNTNIVANGNIIGGGVRSTASATPPNNPVPGDIWFNTTENLLYRYTSDGTRSVWIDISGPTYTFDWQSNVSFAGNLMPNVDLTYYIGNESQRYLSLHSANVYSTQMYTTGTANVGNLVTTNGIFWANGNSYSSGSGGASSSTVYGLNIAFGIGL